MTRFRIASPITLVLRYAKMSIDDMLKSNDSIIKILAGKEKSTKGQDHCATVYAFPGRWQDA